MKHLVMICDFKKSYIYLPYQKNLPIPTKLSKTFYKRERPHLKEAGVAGQISLLTL